MNETADAIANKTHQIEYEVADELDLADFSRDWSNTQINSISDLQPFAWFVNFVVLDGPWAIVTLLLNIANLYINMEYNKRWAGGSIFLVAGTAYQLVQSALSWLLIGEVPYWMVNFKRERMLSLIASTVHIVICLTMLAELFWRLNYKSKNTLDSQELMQAIFEGYMLMMSVTVMPVNVAIIIKEIALEFC